MKRTFKSVLCFVLTVAMLVSALAVSVAAALPEQAKVPSRFQSMDAISNEVVRAIVVLEGKAVIDLGVAPGSEAGLAHERALLNSQAKFLRKAGDLKAAYNYTGLFNGVAVDVTVSQLKKLEKSTFLKRKLSKKKFVVILVAPALKLKRLPLAAPLPKKNLLPCLKKLQKKLQPLLDAPLLTHWHVAF